MLDRAVLRLQMITAIIDGLRDNELPLGEDERLFIDGSVMLHSLKEMGIIDIPLHEERIPQDLDVGVFSPQSSRLRSSSSRRALEIVRDVAQAQGYDAQIDHESSHVPIVNIYTQDSSGYLYANGLPDNAVFSLLDNVEAGDQIVFKHPQDVLSMKLIRSLRTPVEEDVPFLYPNDALDVYRMLNATYTESQEPFIDLQDDIVNKNMRLLMVLRMSKIKETERFKSNLDITEIEPSDANKKSLIAALEEKGLSINDELAEEVFDSLNSTIDALFPPPQSSQSTLIEDRLTDDEKQFINAIKNPDNKHVSPRFHVEKAVDTYLAEQYADLFAAQPELLTAIKNNSPLQEAVSANQQVGRSR